MKYWPAYVAVVFTAMLIANGILIYYAVTQDDEVVESYNDEER